MSEVQWVNAQRITQKSYLLNLDLGLVHETWVRNLDRTISSERIRVIRELPLLPYGARWFDKSAFGHVVKRYVQIGRAHV